MKCYRASLVGNRCSHPEICQAMGCAVLDRYARGLGPPEPELTEEAWIEINRRHLRDLEDNKRRRE